MKKSYVKPQVFFEDFQLSANIAAGCKDKTGTGLHAGGTCGVQYGDDIVFTANVVGCSTQIDDNNVSLCYHIPTDANRLFNS